MDRRAMLEKMVTTRPEDPFPRYGLAMEHRRVGDHAAADAAFSELVSQFPDYVPSYLMYGQMLTEAGDVAKAKEVFERGIQAARAAGDDHAEAELRDAVASMGER